MKKYIAVFACLCMMAGLLTGCSKKDDAKNAESNVNNSTQNAVDNTKKAANDAKNGMEDSIDNVMTYFKDNGIAYENMQTINDMEFAAHEGKSFMMNGNTVYIYRVKSDDENMKKVITEAKDKGLVKVRIDNKEQEYGTQVNGNFLMLYDTKTDSAELQKLFPKYQSTGVHSSDSNADMNKSASTTGEVTEDEKETE